MSALSARSTVVAACAATLLLFALSGCTPEPATDAPVTDSSDSGDSSDSSSDESTTEDTGADAGMTVLPGTGSYAIGTDAPYGGYELAGGVLEQPDGCTWSIVDEDGVVTFADQGQFVFLTDIPEAVTFITNGCPDWQQFE